MCAVSVVVRPTNDAGGVGNEVPGWEETSGEVTGLTVCKASNSSEVSSCGAISDRGVDEEAMAVVGDTASLEVGGTAECSIVHSGTAIELEFSGAIDCLPAGGSGRH